MNISIFAVGKLKDNFFELTQNHYKKLLSHFCRLKIIEIKDEKVFKTTNINSVLEKEENRIMEIFDNKNTENETIILDEKGKTFSSKEFSKWLEKKKDEGKNIQFVIGGAHGLSDKIKEKADLKISLSSFTLPHQMARVVLLEQLYRGFTIMKGKKYHY